MTLVLASRSPQRRAILDAIGIEFLVRAPAFEEAADGPAGELARANAVGKALAVTRGEGEVVLGVDTVVSLDGRTYGKPADAAQARTTLRALSGATHQVLSGIALVGLSAEPLVAVSTTAVRFRALDAATIEWYLASGEWRERAGAYAIQGAGCALVESIEGDHTNVIGLPVGALLALHPSLLTGCNNRFSAADSDELQP